jgi:hypothetical protein
MNYYPDRWLILKMPECYKVFGVWLGSYIHGQSWKLNSGITKVEEFDDHYLFHGYSGSIYNCSKNGYGSTAYGYSLLDGWGEDVIIVRNVEEVIEELKKDVED